MKKIIFLIMLAAAINLSAGVNKTTSEPGRLIYRISFPGMISEDKHFSQIKADLDQWNITDTPGAPELPYLTLQIAVPPAGKINVTTRILQDETRYLDHPLQPAPTIFPGEKTSEFYDLINEGFYSQAQTEPVETGNTVYYRGYTLIPITIYPCSYDHQSMALTVRQEFEVNIEILGNTEWKGSYPADYAWLDRDYIANYQQARFWTQARSLPEYGINWNNSQFWYRIDIQRAGTYCISSQDLDILPDFADLNTLRLFALQPFEDQTGVRYRQQEIPISISEETICFEYPGNGSVLWLALAGEYDSQPARTKINISHPLSIERISEKTSSPRSNRPIECLLIRPESYFETQAEELVELHLQYFDVETAIVIQEDIFAAESGGNAEPLAINSYLDEFYDDNPSLEYVVLMGSGTSDFASSNQKNKIITIDRSSVTSDDYFVDFNYDDRPELVIGRIPAQSESMMNKYLQNLHDYYDNLDQDWWQNRILLVADDENKTGGLEGTSSTSGMNHTLKMEETLDVLTGRLIEKVYGLEYTFDAFQSKPGATQDIIDLINQGIVITYYVGHGAWNNLGDEDYFSVGDIQFLTNSDHLTHFVAGSCNVGKYDMIGNDCIAEAILFPDDGGAVSSVASSEDSAPTSNFQLLRSYLNAICNLGLTSGQALVYAKYNSGAPIVNSNRYNYLGDPVIRFPFPARIGEINGLPDSIARRDTITYNGDFGSTRLNTAGQTLVFDSPQLIHYSNFIPPDTALVYVVDYFKKANTIFRGEVDIIAGLYHASFIVPDDAVSGNNGTILTLTHDEDGSWLNDIDQVSYADSSINNTNSDIPQITIFLDSENFRSGDTVSDTPLLIAHISDNSGINISGSPGRSILVLLDDSDDLNDLIDVTSGFLYNHDSYTQGTLNWELKQLSVGNHNLKLIVYDNFGSPAVALTDFRVAENNDLSITDLLPYPNPMSNSGYFTFILTEAAQVNIAIYTISGKKIKTIRSSAAIGYNQIAWDCRDADGDRLANNTYFYKVKAKNPISGNSAEAVGKLIIFH